MGFGTRLKEIRKYKSYVQKEFAVLLGISQGTLSDLEKNKTAPSFETLKKLKYRFTDISTGWLLTGEGSMFQEESAPACSDTCQFLHIEADIAAGEPLEATGERLETLTVGHTLIRNVNDYFCFRVNGKSMEPDIKHQDLVLIKKDRNWKNKEDTVCAVRVDGEITLKRIIHSEKKKLIVLISDNKGYPPIVIDPKHSDVLMIGSLYLIVRRVE